MVDLTHLNPQQREAVETTEGAILVLAGAGSGKTRVITFRIAQLIRQGASPKEIVALSFTNKAATEMKERVLDLVGSRARGVVLSTFHSLGLRFLREEYRKAGLSKGFTILDEDDQLNAITELMGDAGFDTSIYDPKIVHSVIGHFKSRLERPDPRRGGIEGVAAHLSPLYGRRLRAMNTVDFDDLIALPVWLLESDEELAYRWSGKFRYIMVDEYQDTNLSQLRLLKALGKRHGNICVVGDDDQSIYGWRGAEAGNILRFDQHFAGARTIALTQNYRSTNCILRSANALIQNNAERHEKSLWSELGDGDALRYFEAPDGDEEARWVSADLLSSSREKELPWKSYAVLYRTNAQSRLIEDGLRALDIPYRIVGGTRFYDRKEVKDLMAYLRCIANPWDDSAFRRIINFPARGIGDVTIQKLADTANEESSPFFRILKDPQRVVGLKGQVIEKIRQFNDLIEHFRQRFSADGAQFGQICRALIEKIDFRNVFSRTESDIRKLMRRLNNLDEVAVAMTSFRERHPEASLEEFLTSVSLDRDTDEEEEEENVVSLMTLHSSKGLEFDSVYIIGFEEGFMPHMRNADAESGSGVDITEERRLVYVGLTRARRHLTLTSARKRLKFGRTQLRKPTRFLHEIPEDLFQGDRSGRVPELDSEKLQEKGMSAFDEMLSLVSRE